MKLGAAATLLILVVTTPLLGGGSGPKAMEIFSRLGRKSTVKIYSGESVTFRVRETSAGVDSLFGPTVALHGITFVLREWPIIKQDAIATVKGANRRVVRTKKPERKLWGVPPSRFTVVGGGSAGRYKLTASRKGYLPAEILINLAQFEIIEIDAELTEQVYRASFDVQLVDPAEEGRSIPILFETLDFEGRRIDWRRDVVLAPVMREPNVYRTSRRISLSSHVIEGFAECIERVGDKGVPDEFLDMKPLRIVEGGTIRLSFREMVAVYPLPLGY